MRFLEMSGRNIDEALEKALTELKLTKDKVQVEVLEVGSKGLFNLLWVKPAKIKVSVIKDYSYDAKTFLRQVLDAMGVEAEITIKDEKDVMKIILSGAEMGILIGYRGETLDSLQYLISLVVNRGHDNGYKRIILDTENYRQKREETLKRLAGKMADRVKKSGKYIKLEPMNPYERRIIHSALQNSIDIQTYSEGDEPYRRVVVDLKKA